MLSGVINWAPNAWTGEFHYDSGKTFAVGARIGKLVHALGKMTHHPVAIRSEPVADDDICFLTKSPNVIFSGAGGFALLLSRLQSSVQEQWRLNKV